jgi:hypothetical protein
MQGKRARGNESAKKAKNEKTDREKADSERGKSEKVESEKRESEKGKSEKGKRAQRKSANKEDNARDNEGATESATNARGGDEDWRPQRIVDELPAVERLLVLALLRADHAERWSTAELVRELGGIPADEIECGLLNLAAKGIARIEGEHARAAPPAWGLDDLDMICI